MYPPGAQTVVTVPAIARRWEGEARPHHFQGVATVVTKLLCLVQPDNQLVWTERLSAGRLSPTTGEGPQPSRPTDRPSHGA